MEIKVLEFHSMPSNESRIKAFVDVQVGEIIIREYRVLADWNGLKVVPPRTSWRGKDGTMKHKVIVSLPLDVREKVNSAILQRFKEEKRSAEGPT